MKRVGIDPFLLNDLGSFNSNDTLVASSDALFFQREIRIDSFLVHMLNRFYSQIHCSSPQAAAGELPHRKWPLRLDGLATRKDGDAPENFCITPILERRGMWAHTTPDWKQKSLIVFALSQHTQIYKYTQRQRRRLSVLQSGRTRSSTCVYRGDVGSPEYIGRFTATPFFGNGTIKRPTTDTETLNHTRVSLQIVGTNSNDQSSLQYMYTILLPWKQTTYNPANSYGADWNSILLPIRLGWHLAFIVQVHLAFSNPDHIAQLCMPFSISNDRKMYRYNTGKN